MHLLKKNVILVFKIVIGISILYFLIKIIGFSKIYLTMLKMDLRFLPLVILIYLFTLFIGSLSLKVLIDPLNSNVSYNSINKYFLVSSALGTLTPSRIGEFSLVYFLKKENIGYEYGLTIAFLNKLINLVLLILISLAGFMGFLNFGFVHIDTLIIFILLIIIFLFLFNNLLEKFIVKVASVSFISKLITFKRTFLTYTSNQKKAIAINFGIGFLRMIVSSYYVIIFYASFNQIVGLSSVLIIISITALTSIIPISVNGLGIKETIAIYLFGLIGVKSEIAASVAILSLILTYIINLLILLIYGYKMESNDNASS